MKRKIISNMHQDEIDRISERFDKISEEETKNMNDLFDSYNIKFKEYMKKSEEKCKRIEMMDDKTFSEKFYIPKSNNSLFALLILISLLVLTWSCFYAVVHHKNFYVLDKKINQTTNITDNKKL